MCGIGGIIGSASRLVDINEIVQMMDVVKHRGPDDEGFLLGYNNQIVVAGGRDTPNDVYQSETPYRPTGTWEEASKTGISFAIGNRRLAILDLSPGGHQPQCTPDRKLWLTYNGEIYNYREVRKELMSMGHNFISDSDTEVLLHSYQEWGTDCVSKFNGMWAFAILDLKKRILFCSRDRFGVKPFFYFFGSGFFAFGSEIKQLLQVKNFTPAVNDPILYDFLVMGRVAHDSQTCFRDVMRLPAGHNMILSIDTLEYSSWRYFSLTYDAKLDHFDKSKAHSYAREIKRLLRDAVTRRLVSDAPICLSLSGGLDSSSIVGEAVQLHRSGIVSKLDMRPFTIRFADSQRDEGPKAQLVAEKLGIRTKDLLVDGSSIWDDLESLVWLFDEPIFSSHIYAKWKLMRRMHEDGFKVTLDGQGGDEALCGYESFYYPYLINLLLNGRLPDFITEARTIARRQKVGVFSIVFRTFEELIITVLPPRFARSFESRAFRVISVLDDGYNERFQKRLRLWLNLSQSNSIQTRLYSSEIKFILPAHLQVEDRASMSNSIEMRLPFLDYLLVKKAFMIPGVYKIRHGWLKYLLRLSMVGTVPPEVLADPRKRGLEPPETVWMLSRAGKIKDYVKDTPLISNFIDLQKFDALFPSLMSSDSDPIGHALWRILMVTMWLRVFFSPVRTKGTVYPEALKWRRETAVVR